MFNKDACMDICAPVSRAVAWAWVIFTTLFFLLYFAVPSIYVKTQTQALNGAYQNGQVSGYNTAFSQLGEVLDKQVKGGCKEAIPVNVGSGTLGVVNTACLKGADQSAQPQPQPAPQPVK